MSLSIYVKYLSSSKYYIIEKYYRTYKEYIKHFRYGE